MGGENSEITENTKQVVFESANFNGTSIRKTAIALGMRTDASGRFEKGLDPLNTVPAVERACELVEMLGAGKVYDGMIDVLSYVPNPVKLKLEVALINNLLGLNVSRDQMVEYLKPLGFAVDENDVVTVPSWRLDIAHYSDLAEEVARFYGYDKIPYTMMSGEAMQGGLSTSQKLEKTAGEICRSLGYTEIITYSFISPNDNIKVGIPEDCPNRKAIKILNPLGEDRSIMRTSSLPSMMDTLSRNYSYRNQAVSFYENAKVYLPVDGEDLPVEKLFLTLGTYGDGKSFYDIKGDVETILENMNVTNVRFEAANHILSYHPGRCAAVYIADELLGYIGQIHPTIADNYGIGTEVYAAQLDFNVLKASVGEEKSYIPLPKFPAMSRDIAVICDDEITVAQLTECIFRVGGEHMKNAAFFDVYKGIGIPDGKKSVAFNLTLRSDDKTLTDDVADQEVQNVLTALKNQYGAVLR